MTSLDQLRAGQRGVITAVQGSDPLVQRLLELGFLDGEVVEVVGFAPLGDPVEVHLGHSRLSLRRQEASAVCVRPLDD